MQVCPGATAARGNRSDGLGHRSGGHARGVGDRSGGGSAGRVGHGLLDARHDDAP